MALIALVYLAAQLDLQVAHAHFEYRLHDAPYGQSIAAVSIALLLIALFRLTQMLGRIASGELFSPQAVGHFRGFALWLLIMALFELAAPIAAELFGAARTVPHLVRLAVDLRDVMTVGITLLLFLLARLLERARRLDEEMREFV